MEDPIVFEGKTLSDLFRDVYNRSSSRRAIIKDYIEQLRKLTVESAPESAAVVAPIIAGYIEALIKSDEHLIKLAAIVQRISASKLAGVDGASSELLTEAEKAQLLRAFDDEIANIESHINSENAPNSD